MRRNRQPDDELYILIRKQPKRCHDVNDWLSWMDNNREQRIVGWDSYDHGARVVTRFIGFDVAPTPALGPLLFETYVKGGTMDGLVHNYRTWKAAEQGHWEACWQVRESLH